MLDRRRLIAAGIAGFALASFAAAPQTARAEDEATWASLKPDVFGAREIADGAGVITLDAPYRAEDAALVPVGFHAALPEGDARTVKAVTLIVDENPSPVVAKFRFGDGRHDVGLSTRIRVNNYSFVRVIAETSDGKLYMAKAYVKAAGGCSAPAGKDPEEAKANLGRMRFTSFDKEGRREAQFQLRHPNNSGLQMDQVTHLFIPPWFVRELEISRDGKPVLSMEGGISISEDPTFRFSVAPGPGEFEVKAVDTENKAFTGAFEVKQGS